MIKKLKNLEDTINKRLQEISPSYGISNLTLTPEGKYEFDLRVTFDPSHLNQVKKVFQTILGGFETQGKEEKIQTKVYLPRNVHEKLKQIAFQQGRSHSEIIEECISQLVNS